MHDLLTFNAAVHGSAVRLGDGGRRAVRSPPDAIAGGAIVFSASPVKIDRRVCIEVRQRCGPTAPWSGALRVGYTVVDPAAFVAGNRQLPAFACPDLAEERSGCWLRALPESLFVRSATRLTVCVESSTFDGGGGGGASLLVNNEPKGMLFDKLPTDRPLWLVVDIYGNTTGVRLVHAGIVVLELVPSSLKADCNREYLDEMIC